MESGLHESKGGRIWTMELETASLTLEGPDSQLLQITVAPLTSVGLG